MSTDLTLHQRRRAPTTQEMAGIPWLQHLNDAEREQIVPALVVGDALAGDLVCRVGKAPTYWFGVIEGLLKMSTDSADGGSVTFTGLPSGGWFGEGTAIKKEPESVMMMAELPEETMATEGMNVTKTELEQPCN